MNNRIIQIIYSGHLNFATIFYFLNSFTKRTTQEHQAANSKLSEYFTLKYF